MQRGISLSAAQHATGGVVLTVVCNSTSVASPPLNFDGHRSYVELSVSEADTVIPAWSCQVTGRNMCLTCKLHFVIPLRIGVIATSKPHASEGKRAVIAHRCHMAATIRPPKWLHSVVRSAAAIKHQDLRLRPVESGITNLSTARQQSIEAMSSRSNKTLAINQGIQETSKENMRNITAKLQGNLELQGIVLTTITNYVSAQQTAAEQGSSVAVVVKRRRISGLAAIPTGEIEVEDTTLRRGQTVYKTWAKKLAFECLHFLDPDILDLTTLEKARRLGAVPAFAAVRARLAHLGRPPRQGRIDEQTRLVPLVEEPLPAIGVEVLQPQLRDLPH